MDPVSIIFIAIGLAMDAFAISVYWGFSIKVPKLKDALKIALSFGLFQSLMPLVGWELGINLIKYIFHFVNWLAFFLLITIGIKIIHDSINSESKNELFYSLDLKHLLLLSFVTSIDALAVGFSFALLEISIIGPILIIGAIGFILSFLGFFIGEKFGHVFETKIKIIGGIILIVIGFKILLQTFLN